MSSENQAVEKQADTYPFLIDYLPEEYVQKATKELNETMENKSTALGELKLKAKSEEDVKEIEFHEDFLIQFLRQSKYDVQRSLKRLLAFTKFRKQYDSVFKSVDEEEISKNPNYKFCTPLPWRCQDGCAITVYDYSKWQPSGIPLEDIIRLGLIMNQQALRNPVTQINGVKMIIDFKDASLSQFGYMNPKYLLTAYKAFMTCTPARNKQIHMVNESSVMKAIWTFFRPFLSHKLKNRFIFHSRPEDLLNYFPKHALPVQYGGDLEDYYMGDWMGEANEQQKISTLTGQCNSF